tara:strand:- start:268 stop:429 length:162 start_codon:yes stop_codon:yes gene_type:complete
MGIFIWLATVLVFAASWVTHIIHCFNEEAWGFLIAGALLVPVAVCHGVWLWFV